MKQNFLILLIASWAGLVVSSPDVARAHSASTAWIQTSMVDRVLEVQVEVPSASLRVVRRPSGS